MKTISLTKPLVVSALVLVLCSFASRVSAQGEGLTLRQAVSLAIERNAQILQAQEGLAGSAAKVDESRSALLPQVSAQASYARVGPIASYTVSLGPFGPPITMKFGIENIYNAGLSVQQSLFNWGRTQAGIEMSEIGVKLAESSLEITRQNVAYQLTQLFYGILLSKAGIDVLDESIHSLESRLQTTKTRYDAGLASNFDLLTMEVQIANVKSRRLEAENNLKKLCLLFNKLTGRDLSDPVVLSGALTYEPAAPSLESMVRTAIANRRELEQMKHQESMALAQMDLTNSLNKPNVNMSVAWGLRNGFMPNLDVFRGNWNASVVLAYPLFDGFRVKNQLDQADVNLKLTRMRYQDLTVGVAMEVHQAVSDVKMNEEKIRIEEVKVKQAEEALTIAGERHEKGLLSVVDLLDAHTVLENAKLSQLQTVYNAILSKANLDKAIGIAPY
jgi:outer membrane protein